MSQKSKKELMESIRPRYLKANKKRKEQILDEFVAATGYHRKYAIRLLNKGTSPKGIKKAGRRKKYEGEVVKVLEEIWEIYGRICSRRLHPFLPEMVGVLERHGELEIKDETKELLLSMSRATIDRCLKNARFDKAKGISTTKPGALLKKAIPVRTWTEWDDARPGFIEIDLVAHCGQSVEGQYINTLTAVDISTGWTECFGIYQKTQKAVFEAILELRKRLPFPLLGIDSDNGSEFINGLLFDYCQQEKITFTRSRPYKKNDQAHVEQKNWSIVRRTLGYDRYESDEELTLIRSIYDDLRFYTNFFQPVLKLVGKTQINGKLKKSYDIAATPFRRVIDSDQVNLETKANLLNHFTHLNPVALRNTIDHKVAVLWKLSR